MPLIYTFQENQTGTFSAILKDELNNLIGSNDILTLTLTITDQVTQTVINNRFQQDILNNNNVTLGVGGNLSWQIQTEDNEIVTPHSPPGTVERHEILFEWTWGISKYSNELYYFDVTQIYFIGVPGIDTYGSALGGDSYFSSRLNSDAWDNATDADKYAALVEASRLIDCLNFVGDKSVETQFLEFPRDGAVTVPDNINNAAYELAIKLLEGSDPDQEIDLLRTASLQYDGVRESFHSGIVPEWVASGIVSSRAWRYLKPYLRDPKVLTMYRA